MKCKHLMECHGSATVGDRGQFVLPMEARKKFGIKPGDKLLVMGAETGGFQRILLMKSEAVTKLMQHMFNFEKLIKGGNFEGLEKAIKKPVRKKSKGSK